MSFPVLPLGCALVHNQDYIDFPESRLYKKLSVKLYGKGVILDTPADGALLKMQRHQLARSGQVILSEIWGKKGAVGIVPPEGDGALCTSHFFLFDIDEEVAVPGWIELLLRGNYLQPQLDNEARGSTGYAAVRPRHLLRATVPLPELDVQRRVVELVESALQRLQKAEQLAASMTEDFDRLLIAMAHRDDLADEEKVALGWRRVRLGEVMRLDLDPVKVDPLNRYKTAGCYSYARGLFHKEPVSGLEYQSPFLYRMKAGQFSYLKLKAFEGSFAFVSTEFEGCCVSNEYPMFSMDPALARAEWLFAHFKAPRTWAGLASSSKGIGARRERVNPTAMLAHEVWLPPMAEQQKIAEVLNAKRQYDALDTFEKDAEALRHSILSKAFRGELV